jgi:hypothetical protein
MSFKSFKQQILDFSQRIGGNLDHRIWFGCKNQPSAIEYVGNESIFPIKQNRMNYIKLIEEIDNFQFEVGTKQGNVEKI